MQDLSIDLRLAVNYLPACVCALQSVALSFLLSALHSVRLLPAFVPVCLLLVIDRSTPRSLRIFDGSAVLFSVFLAHCVAAMQEFGEGGFHLWPTLHLVFSVEWPCAGLYFLLRHPSARDALALRVFLGCACFRVSCYAFLYRPESGEHRLVRVGRDLAFAGLCLVWTYVVGIYRRRLTHQPTESAVHFAIYFWPVMYVHAYAACTYAFVAFAVIVVQLRQPEHALCSLDFLYPPPRPCATLPGAAGACADPPLQASAALRDDDDDCGGGGDNHRPDASEDELILRQALMSTRQPHASAV